MNLNISNSIIIINAQILFILSLALVNKSDTKMIMKWGMNDLMKWMNTWILHMMNKQFNSTSIFRVKNKKQN